MAFSTLSSALTDTSSMPEPLDVEALQLQLEVLVSLKQDVEPE